MHRFCWMLPVLALWGCTPKQAGLRAVAAGDPGSGVRELREAVRLEPRDAEAQRALGLAYLDLADAALAERHLDEAAKLLPGDRVARRMLALVRERLGWQVRAIQTWEELIGSHPADRLTPAFKTHLVRLSGAASRLTPEAGANRVEALREKGLLDDDNLPRSVVVLPFRGPAAYPDYDLLGRTLGRLIAAELSRLDLMWVMGPDEAARRMELLGVAWNPEDLTGSMRTVGKAFGAGLVIGGVLRRGFEDEIRADVILADPDPFAKLVDTRTEGTPEKFFVLEREVIDKLISAMDLLPNERERARFGRFNTTRVMALAHHLEGVALFLSHRTEQALGRLGQAVAIDAEFPCPHRVIALIERMRGEAERARTALRKGHGRGNPLCIAEDQVLAHRIGRDARVAEMLQHDLEQARTVMRDGVRLLFTGETARLDLFMREGCSGGRPAPAGALPPGWVWGAGSPARGGLADPSTLGGAPGAGGISAPDPATAGSGGTGTD